MEVEITVHDETGHPIEDATVETEHYHWMLRSPISNLAFPVLTMDDFLITKTRRTNKQGKCSFSFYSKDSRIPFEVTKEGYYVSRKSLSDRMPETKRKWTRDAQQINIAINRIKKQIPLLTWNMRSHIHPLPYDSGEFVGFDLLLQDWTPPYGKGEIIDMLVSIKKDYKYLDSGDDTHPFVNVKLEFPGEGNGIQEIKTEHIMSGSLFPYPHEAPQDGYELKTFKQDVYIKKRVLLNTQNENFNFRVRTQVDAQGKVTNAIYGRITGENGKIDVQGGDARNILVFDCVINSIPNNRNLEPIRNNFGNIIPYTPPEDEKGNLR